jgi:predicted transcriptional regulator
MSSVLPSYTTSVMTIRLSADQADELETVAAVDDQPVSEVIRAAITAHIAQGKQDEDFQQGLRVAQDLP